MLKRIASHLLYLLVMIVTLFTGGAGGGPQWTPERKDLEVMSQRNAIVVISLTLLLFAGLIYLVIRAFRA
ncbi:MAG: hypothetical protein ABWX90_01175 [Candidatus Saccharimonadales bacterium]